MESNSVSISIVTPVYNRADLLYKCYQSLVNQTNYDFEWIIIDDGSTDNSLEVARSFKADFPIKVITKKNGGKHTALNASHPYIAGKYVLILDSDDYLIPAAVDTVINGWSKYDVQDEVAMVVFLRGSDENHPLCMAFTDDEGKQVDIIRYNRKTIVSLDACEVIRTELFKKYPFPVFEGEKFVAEGALWSRVGLTHKCVYINKVIYICEYLEGGLTKSGKPMRIHNPNGGMYTSNLGMNKKNFLKSRIKNGLLYNCYSFFAKKTFKEVFRQSDSKFLMCFCRPFGFALYLLWKKKYY